MQDLHQHQQEQQPVDDLEELLRAPEGVERLPGQPGRVDQRQHRRDGEEQPERGVDRVLGVQEDEGGDPRQAAVLVRFPGHAVLPTRPVPE